MWFASAGATALTLGAARHRWVAVVPAVAAGAALLLAAQGMEGLSRHDERAGEPVCAPGRIEVCVDRQRGFLLDDFTEAARPVVQRWENVAGAPARIAGFADSRAEEVDGGTVYIPLGPHLTRTGGLAPTDEVWGARERHRHGDGPGHSCPGHLGRPGPRQRGGGGVAAALFTAGLLVHGLFGARVERDLQV